MPRDLNNTSEIATEAQNIANQRSTILTVQPKDGTGLLIKGMVQKGKEKGLPLIGSFVDQNGDPISPQSTLSLAFIAPGDDDETTVTFPMSNVRSYESLDVTQQQDEDYIDAIKHVIKGTDAALSKGNMPRVGVGHLDELRVKLTSPDVVDWSHPDTRLAFYRNAVEEV